MQGARKQLDGGCDLPNVDEAMQATQRLKAAGRLLHLEKGPYMPRLGGSLSRQEKSIHKRQKGAVEKAIRHV